MFSKYFKIVIVVIALGFVVGGGVGYLSSNKQPANDVKLVSGIGLREPVSYWKDELRTKGPAKAYKEFLKANADNEKGHNVMHIFAALLYERLGLDGLKYCDSSFNSGCYHGFFAAAIAADGESVIPKLAEICDKEFKPDPSGCQHGIGHGLVEFYGQKDLVKSLTACSHMSWRGKLMGCSSGVFMEYNFPISLKNGNLIAQTRIGKPTDLLYPCDSISIYKESCFHELAQYFIEQYRGDYSQVASSCRAIKESNYRKYCFFGIGAAISPYLSFNIDKIKQTCDDMGEYSLACRQGAAQGLYGDYRAGPAKSKQVCEGLDTQDFETCVRRYSVGVL